MINQLAKSYIADTNLVVSITAPEKAGVIVPTRDQILAALDDTRKAELTAKAEEVLNKPLLDKTPKAGKDKENKTKSGDGNHRDDTEQRCENSIQTYHIQKR